MRERFNEKIEFFLALLTKEIGELFSNEFLENSLFLISDTSTYNYLRIEFLKNEGIKFSVYINSLGIGFDIDRISEAMEWNIDYLQGDSIHCFLRDLFYSNIYVYYFGDSITEIIFFDSTNNPIREIKKSSFFSFKFFEKPLIHKYQSIIKQ